MDSKFTKIVSALLLEDIVFSQRIINDWNTLPPDIVFAPNVLIIKTTLDLFLYDHRFYFSLFSYI